MTAPTPDAVAQAREALMLSVAALRDIADSDAVHHSGWGAMIHRHADAIAGTCYSRIVAAVRAECAAKYENWVLDRIAALGPQPDLTKSDAARYAWAGKATAYDAMLAHVTGADVETVSVREAQP